MPVAQLFQSHSKLLSVAACDQTLRHYFKKTKACFYTRNVDGFMAGMRSFGLMNAPFRCSSMSERIEFLTR